MKNFLQAILFFLSIIFIASCSSDDPDPTHEMGSWTLENFIVTELPATFATSEGAIRTISYYGYESYNIELNADHTVLITIKYTGQPTIAGEGTWTILEGSENDDLIITLVDGDDESILEFKVIKNETNQLWISENINPNNGLDFFLSDATKDQLIADHGGVDGANQYLTDLFNSTDPADEATLNDLFDTPSFDLLYTFIREN